MKTRQGKDDLPSGERVIIVLVTLSLVIFVVILSDHYHALTSGRGGDHCRGGNIIMFPRGLAGEAAKEGKGESHPRPAGRE